LDVSLASVDERSRTTSSSDEEARDAVVANVGATVARLDSFGDVSADDEGEAMDARPNVKNFFLGLACGGVFGADPSGDSLGASRVSAVDDDARSILVSAG